MAIVRAAFAQQGGERGIVVARAALGEVGCDDAAEFRVFLEYLTGTVRPVTADATDSRGDTQPLDGIAGWRRSCRHHGR